MIPIIYHGSIASQHGRGYLTGTSGPERYIILTVFDHRLINVRRESFTILDDDLRVPEEEIVLNLA